MKPLTALAIGLLVCLGCGEEPLGRRDVNDHNTRDVTEQERRDAERAYENAKRYMDRAELGEAISELTAAIRLNPSHVRAYLERAEAYRRQGEIVS